MLSLHPLMGSPFASPDECGIVAQIAEPLATADISAYYISTFNFDHALVSPHASLGTPPPPPTLGVSPRADTRSVPCPGRSLRRASLRSSSCCSSARRAADSGQLSPCRVAQHGAAVGFPLPPHISYLLFLKLPPTMVQGRARRSVTPCLLGMWGRGGLVAAGQCPVGGGAVPTLPPHPAGEAQGQHPPILCPQAGGLRRTAGVPGRGMWQRAVRCHHGAGGDSPMLAGRVPTPCRCPQVWSPGPMGGAMMLWGSPGPAPWGALKASPELGCPLAPPKSVRQRWEGLWFSLVSPWGWPWAAAWAVTYPGGTTVTPQLFPSYIFT